MGCSTTNAKKRPSNYCAPTLLLLVAACSHCVLPLSVRANVVATLATCVLILCQVPFLPGEQYGNAIADIIYGSVIPQAKLPLSFPNHANEQNMSQHQYPGVSTSEYSYQATYSEGQIVGYRYVYRACMAVSQHHRYSDGAVVGYRLVCVCVCACACVWVRMGACVRAYVCRVATPRATPWVRCPGCML